MTTEPLCLTHTPDEHHAASLLSLGESALTMVVARSTLLEVKTGIAAARERRGEPPEPRAQIRAWSELGAALMELDRACHRLERAGLFDAARDLNARKDRRIKALDRAC